MRIGATEKDIVARMRIGATEEDVGTCRMRADYVKRD
jgi:hypothetical protein